MWSNADEVQEFLKAERFDVGDRLVLPDIEQAYVVRAVRPFRSKRGVQLYLEFEATCAVEGCGCDFLFTKAVSEMRNSPYLMRTCPEHRRGWSTPMEDAWVTQEVRAVRAAAKATREQEALEQPRQRLGANERTVLFALDEMMLVVDRPKVSELLGYAVGKLPSPPTGSRDTRRQQLSRALWNLDTKGLIAVELMRVRRL